MDKMKKKRTQRLRHLMDAHQVTADEVGTLLGRTGQTVRVWRCADESRTIPRDALDVLEVRLPEYVATRSA